MKLDFSKGLIPAIIIDDNTKEVLMLAYMNEEAFQKSIETNETWFYSRSREALWNKGATSGNKQTIVSMRVDCDEDTLLVHVLPEGPACHTGEYSCFYRDIPLANDNVNTKHATRNVFHQVMEEIEERQQVPKENSYTNYLLDKGIDKIGKKVIEEAGEIVIAAKNNDKNEIINECSDLLYHSFVLLAEQGVSLSQVEAELMKRFAKKGNSKGDRKEITNW